MLRGSSKKGTSSSTDNAPLVGGVSSFAEDDKKAATSKWVVLYAREYVCMCVCMCEWVSVCDDDTVRTRAHTRWRCICVQNEAHPDASHRGCAGRWCRKFFFVVVCLVSSTIYVRSTFFVVCLVSSTMFVCVCVCVCACVQIRYMYVYTGIWCDRIMILGVCILSVLEYFWSFRIYCHLSSLGFGWLFGRSLGILVAVLVVLVLLLLSLLFSFTRPPPYLVSNRLAH